MVAVGRPAYFKLKIKPDSKTADNALAMLAIAASAGLPIQVVVKTAVDMYGSDWCQKVFGKDHPPFNVIIADRCRKRLVKKYSEREAMTDGDVRSQAVDTAKNMVAMLGLEGAKKCVDEGWPTDPRLRAAVKKILLEA